MANFIWRNNAISPNNAFSTLSGQKTSVGRCGAMTPIMYFHGRMMGQYLRSPISERTTSLRFSITTGPFALPALCFPQVGLAVIPGQLWSSTQIPDTDKNEIVLIQQQ